ncbi:MAG: hypothetical protein QXL16_01315 [Candidatus Micrarchaeaceae archaeon]
MGIEKLDPILKYIPSIKKPQNPLSFREKLRNTAIVLVAYFLLFSIPAFGVNIVSPNEPLLQLVNIIFAARIGTLVTVGIGPIVLASIFLQLLSGSGFINMNLDDPEEKGRFQGFQKFLAMIIAVVEGFIFVGSGYVQALSKSLIPVVAIQLALGAILVIYLDETMVKYGITSGINLFIASGVAYAIVAGTINVLFVEAEQAISAGGAAAIANAILAFGPLFFTILIMVISAYIYDIKVELPLVFSQLRGIGGRLPIPLLYVSVLPVILATSLELSFTVWFRFLANVGGSFANLARFFAYYQPIATVTGATTLNLAGGIIYLISPSFPLPYSTAFQGIGGYPAYFHYLATQTSTLFLPWGGKVFVPEWLHFIIYAAFLVILCVIFGKFWIEMTGQSPSNVAAQLQEIGWQIPGFRRDPRIVENILNRYVPTITVLGSIIVGLLAALATLTGAVGTGMGVLLTVGIMYMVYQQLQQENAIQGMPMLEKLLS